MQRLVLTTVAILAAAGLPALAPAVTVINVDFQPTINDPSVTSNVYTVNYSGAGAAPDAGTAWNSLNASNPSPAAFIGAPGYYDEVVGSASYNDLVNSLGVPTTLDISFTAGGAFGIASTAPNLNNIAANAQGLMRDYLIAFGGAPRTVTITGLDPNEPLILYAYGEGDNTSNDRATTFNANGVIASTAGDAGPHADLALGSDYVRLTGVTASPTGTLTITYAASNGPEGPFNGFQLLYDLTVGIPGDTDGDNDVDINDYNRIRNNFRRSGVLTRLDGDIAGPNSNVVGDGTVDFYDFIAWQTHFGSPGAVGSDPGAVPEPASCVLAAGAVAALVVLRRRVKA